MGAGGGTRHPLAVRPTAKILWELHMAKSNPRRTIIREWMTLAREKRQSSQQASAFAEAALQRHPLPRRRRQGQEIIMAWLRPRIGRP
jgi:hypothetical protein